MLLAVQNGTLLHNMDQTMHDIVLVHVCLRLVFHGTVPNSMESQT